MKWKELIIGGLVAFIVGVLLLSMEYHTGLFQTTTSKRVSPVLLYWSLIVLGLIGASVLLIYSKRARSTLKLAIRRVSTVVKRAWRPVLIIGAIVWLGIWTQRNLLIQPLHPLSSWTFWQYAFAIALVVPLALLVYILLVEPWLRARRMERPQGDAIKWSNSGNLFWASHDLRLTIAILSRGDAPSEDIVDKLQQSLHHVQELGFDGPLIESKLAGLTAGAGSTLGQNRIWTQWRDYYKEKLESLIGKIGDHSSDDQKRLVGFFDSGPKGDMSKYASYSFEHDFRSGLNDAWTTPGGWLPRVDNERGVLLVHHDDLRKVLFLEELPLFMNGLIECEVYLEPGALFDVMLRGSFNVTQPRGLDNEYYMARFDARPGWPDCICIKQKGDEHWHECNDWSRLNHRDAPHGQPLMMRIEVDGQRICLYRDGNPVDQIDNAKVTTGRISLFAEMANVYVRKVRISPKFPWDV